MGYPTRIDLCDGKYSVVFNFETGQSEALRYGERWRDLRGDKMVLAMFNRIVELEEQLKTCATVCSEELVRGRLIGAPQKLRFEAGQQQANEMVRPQTPVGWSDTDWIKHLQDNEGHPLMCLHINKGSLDAAAEAYESEYNAWKKIERLRNRVMHLELYLKGEAYCPCCTGLRECEEGCTFAEDDRSAHERMIEVRAVLYGG